MLKFYLFPCLSLLDSGDCVLLAVVVVEMEKAGDQDMPLDAERRHQEIEGHSREAVLFQEGHQEAKADKDHHVNILKTYRGTLISRAIQPY